MARISPSEPGPSTLSSISFSTCESHGSPRSSIHVTERSFFLRFSMHFCPIFRPQPARPFRPPTISPEYRLYDLNKRLSMRNEVRESGDGSVGRSMMFFSKDCDQHWWEMFAHQFFEDDATLILTIPLDDESKRFSKRIYSSVIEYDTNSI